MVAVEHAEGQPVRVTLRADEAAVAAVSVSTPLPRSSRLSSRCPRGLPFDRLSTQVGNHDTVMDLVEAQERYAATPERDRVLAPAEASQFWKTAT